MIRPNSQNAKILQYMREHGGITTMEAFLDLGITRLSGRIYELKENGYDIKTRDIEVPTRTGKIALVTRYSLA